MARTAAPASRGEFKPSLKRLIAQQYKSYDSSLKNVDDGTVWQAIRAEFPEVQDEGKLAEAIFPELQNQPAFGAARVMPETVVEATPLPKPKPSWGGLLTAIPKTIAQQATSLVTDLPQGITKMVQGESALREAVSAPPAFATPSDYLTPAEQQLRAEEAQTVLGKGTRMAMKGAAPILGGLTGMTVASKLAPGVLQSMMATGTDFGVYEGLTALGEGANGGEALLRAAGSAAIGAAGGFVGRGALNYLERRASAQSVAKAALEALRDNPAPSEALHIPGSSLPNETERLALPMGSRAPEKLRLESGREAIPMGPGAAPELEMQQAVERTMAEGAPETPWLPRQQAALESGLPEPGGQVRLPLENAAQPSRTPINAEQQLGMANLMRRGAREHTPEEIAASFERSYKPKRTPVEQAALEFGPNKPKLDLTPGDVVTNGRGLEMEVVGTRGPGFVDVKYTDPVTGEQVSRSMSRFDVFKGPPGGIYKKLFEMEDAARERLAAMRAEGKLKNLLQGEGGRLDVQVLADYGAIVAMPLLRRGIMAGEIASTYAARKLKEEFGADFFKAQGLARELPKIIKEAKKQVEIALSSIEGWPDKKRLEELFNRGLSTKDWYKSAYPAAEALVGEDADLLLKLIAATSPNTEWVGGSAKEMTKDNISKALYVYTQAKLGKRGTALWQTLRTRAGGGGLGIKTSEMRTIRKVLNGTFDWADYPKVGPFLQNLRGDFDKVTVDTIIGQVYGMKAGDTSQVKLRWMRPLIVRSIKKMAKERGLKPAQVQSALWSGLKRERGDVVGDLASRDILKRMKGKVSPEWMEAHQTDTQRTFRAHMEDELRGKQVGTPTAGEKDLAEKWARNGTFDNAAKAHATNEGSTFDPKAGTDLGGKPFISVSLWPERTQLIEGATVTPQQLQDFAMWNSDLLQNPEAALGTWFDKSSGKTYIDVVAALPKSQQQQAETLGKMYNQKAIFDLETFTEIPTGGTGDPIPGRPPGAYRMPGFEKLKAAAIRIGDRIWTGPLHRAVAKKIAQGGEISLRLRQNAEAGYVTNTGRFVSLEDGTHISEMGAQRTHTAPKESGAEHVITSEEIDFSKGQEPPWWQEWRDKWEKRRDKK